MNNLQHIRSMAEMILKQVNELEGKNSASPQPKFNVGDRVSTCSLACREVECMVEEVRQYNDQYRQFIYTVRRIDNNNTVPVWESNLEQVKAPATPKTPTPKFNVGDKVVWLSDCNEEPMTVTSVSIDTFNTGNPQVVFPNESGIYYEYHVVTKNGNDQVIGEAALKLYVAPEAENRVWHSGPPPHIGWWNASANQDRGVWRWWDGKSWSLAVGNQESAAMASVRATQHYYKPNGEIEWTDYWPENARVPRIDPGVEQ